MKRYNRFIVFALVIVILICLVCSCYHYTESFEDGKDKTNEKGNDEKKEDDEKKTDVENKVEAYAVQKKPDTTKHTLSCGLERGSFKKQLDEVREGSCKNCVKDYRDALNVYEKDMSTPIVFKRDGEFYVYIYKDSPLHKQFGYFGARSYGDNRVTALELFIRNFPNMPIPDILRYDGDPTQSARACPFILRDGNPCSSHACEHIDWSQRDLSQQNLTDDCKWNISSYCTKNAGLDPSCACWDTNGEFYNTDYCKQFRKNFETPKDYKCSINLFDINEHQDMSQYIKRDKIPCWDCDLEAPAAPLQRSWTTGTS